MRSGIQILFSLVMLCSLASCGGADPRNGMYMGSNASVVVSPDGDVTRMQISFTTFVAGGISKANIDTQGKWPIVDDAFTISTGVNNFSVTIKGTFKNDTTIEGTWKVKNGGSGSWNATKL